MQQNWKRMLPVLLAVALLCGCGGQNTTVQIPEQTPPAIQQEQEERPEVLPEETAQPEVIPEGPAMEGEPEAPEPTEPVPDAVASATPENAPEPVEPEEAVISDAAYTCTISISCAAVLDNLDALPPEKAGLIPEDGWVLEPTTVTFYEGESVFNLLQRTCKQQRIHLEFEDTPIYNSAYIEGIHNLYEFDCGDRSGWMYQVNGWFPNYGCSRYQLQDGDAVCWEYTCDLGADVNGYASATQQS